MTATPTTTSARTSSSMPACGPTCWPLRAASRASAKQPHRMPTSMRWGHSQGSQSPWPRPPPPAQAPPDPWEVKLMGSFSRLVHSRPTPCLLGPPEHLARPQACPHVSSPGWARFHLPPPRICCGPAPPCFAPETGTCGPRWGSGPPPGLPRQRRAGAAPGRARSHAAKEHGTHVT